jgi:hypothetical protein
MTNLTSDLDATAYSWKQIEGNSLHWRRRALGPESTWMLKTKDYREIFVSGSLILEIPVSISKFTEAAQKAWIDLRFEIPDIAVTTIIGDDEDTYMEYRELEDEAEIRSWLERTAIVEYGSSMLSFQELRDKLMLSKRLNNTDSTYIIIHSTPETEIDNSVRSCQLMLNVDHQISDGIGARILFGKFLSVLSKSLGEEPRNFLDGQTESRNGNRLSVPWIEVMNDEQVLSGPEYEKLVGANKHYLSKLVIILLYTPTILRSKLISHPEHESGPPTFTTDIPSDARIALHNYNPAPEHITSPSH